MDQYALATATDIACDATLTHRERRAAIMLAARLLAPNTSGHEATIARLKAAAAETADDDSAVELTAWPPGELRCELVTVAGRKARDLLQARCEMGRRRWEDRTGRLWGR